MEQTHFNKALMWYDKTTVEVSTIKDTDIFNYFHSGSPETQLQNGTKIMICSLLGSSLLLIKSKDFLHY